MGLCPVGGDLSPTFFFVLLWLILVLFDEHSWCSFIMVLWHFVTILFLFAFIFSETECDWGNSEEALRRHEFCSRVEGYGSVCSCTDPSAISFSPEKVGSTLILKLSFSSRLHKNIFWKCFPSAFQLHNSKVEKVPVVIIASNRPHYLYRWILFLILNPNFSIDLISTNPAHPAGIKIRQNHPKLQGISHCHFQHPPCEIFSFFQNFFCLVIVHESARTHLLNYLSERLLKYFAITPIDGWSSIGLLHSLVCWSGFNKDKIH